MILSGRGVSIDLPTGWEGRIAAGATLPAPLGLAVVHLGNFALPADHSGFGSVCTGQVGSGRTFIAMVEYGPDLGGRGIYQASKLPLPLLAGDFAMNRLQVLRRRQAGAQLFATLSGRPFVVYVVVSISGTCADLDARIEAASRILGTLSVSPRAAISGGAVSTPAPVEA